MGRLTANLTEDVRLSFEEIGPAISVHLDDEDAAASWELAIDVRINEGRRLLGTVITAPPALSVPAVRSRVVAIAMCPGAVEWFVRARMLVGGDGTEAELSIATSRCCPGLPVPGVSAVAPFAVEAQNNPLFFDTLGAAATVGSLLVVPARLKEIMAARNSAGASWLQLWSQPAAPVGGVSVCTIEPILVTEPVAAAGAGRGERVYSSPLPFTDKSWWSHSLKPDLYDPADPLWVRATWFTPP